MYISNISGFAKESYGKLPETGTITAALPDQNLAPIIITDVSQFQTSVREEAQR